MHNKKALVPLFYYKDKNVAIFLLNAFLVVFGYFLAIVTNLESLQAMKSLKMIVLIISITLLLKNKYHKNIFKFNLLAFSLFSFWVLFSILWSSNRLRSLSIYITFVPAIFYIILFISYLTQQYTLQTCKTILESIFKIVYIFPLLYFAFFIQNFESSGIYGISDENQGFVSNHFGWSSSLIVLIYFSSFGKGISFLNLFDILIILLSLIILVFSNNRSSLLAVFLAMIVFLFNLKNTSLGKNILKFIILIFFSLFVFQQYYTKDSALDYMINKSMVQLEDDSEPRFLISSYSLNIVQNDLFSLFFGFGFYNNEFVKASGFNFTDYHNSYADVLFGTGLIGFILFFWTFYSRSSSFYIKHVNKFLYIFPIVIIPYFESNLTTGQFLFYPWFTYLVFGSFSYKLWSINSKPFLG